MELSKRLEVICGMIPPCEMLADIGTDHAFVPIEAVRRGRAVRSLACDVVPGPLERAGEHIDRSGLGDRIETRLGDGLRPLAEGEADCILIAGMGGRLILRILGERRDISESVPVLILSPHTDVPEVRRSLRDFGRRIESEAMVEEDGKFYTVMRTVPAGTERELPELTERECLFGPVLLRERPEVFLKWLKNGMRKTEELIRSLSETESGRTEKVLSEKTRYLMLLREAFDDTEDGGNTMKTLGSSAYLAAEKPYLQKLLDELLKEYDYVSVLGTDVQAKSYSVSGQGIRIARDTRFTKRGSVVRVRKDGKNAEYSFNHIDDNEIPVIVKKIREELKTMADRLPEGLTVMERGCDGEEKISFVKGTEYELHPEELGDEKIIDGLKKIRETGKARNGKILDCMASANYQEVHKIFLSKNKDLEQNILMTCGAIMAMARRDEEVKDNYRPYSILGGAEILSKMEADVPDLIDVTVELLDCVPMIPGEYDCVCPPDVTGMIVHEAFGHGVEMDMFVKDRALAKKFIGEYVASPMVTMHDGATAWNECGSYFFDDEGTIPCDTIVIDKGILKTGMCDALAADSLGIPGTGNGRRESYERKAYTRMTNTYFEGGHDTVEDMVKSIDYGMYLECPTSGMEDPKNWGIQCMVSFAREIKDGKFTGKIFSPIVLSGYVPDLLKSITMMSETPELCGSGMCGKGYKEWVKVSDGGPYMKARIRLG